MMLPTITPNWQAPAHIRAFTTTRLGGVSVGPLASLNVGIRSGDLPEAVQENRQRLRQVLPSAPQWLHQVHGVRCIKVKDRASPDEFEADASCTAVPGVVLAILTADCLPVFLTDREGSEVALAHAGWRGLSQGVLESTVQSMAKPPRTLIAHLGPAIGPQAFEVGPEVREAFIKEDREAASAFGSGRADRFYADLYQLARLKLKRLGVEEVSGGDRCTFTESELFYSHRRDPKSGRMASVIWIDSPL